MAPIRRKTSCVPAAGPAPAAAPQDVDVMLAQLERLGRLHASGVLTDAELAQLQALTSKLRGADAPGGAPTP